MVLALMRAYKNVKSLCLKQKPRHDSRKEPMKNGHVYVIVKTKEHFWDFSSARPRDERMYLDECGNKDLSHGLIEYIDAKRHLQTLCNTKNSCREKKNDFATS